MKKQLREVSTIPKQERKFKKPNSISKTLKCSICMEVFHQPTRLYCGHTFCFQCLQDSAKQKATCPMCREPIDSKNTGKDLLAFNIINELQVFCIHEDCSWEGTLDMLALHVNYQCLYDQMKRQGKGKAKKINEPPKLFLDQEVEEKINENVVRGNLISRVMMKDDSFKTSRSFDIARQIIRTESGVVDHQENQKTKKVQKIVEQAESPPQKIKHNNDDIDFLMELYQSSK